MVSKFKMRRVSDEELNSLVKYSEDPHGAWLSNDAMWCALQELAQLRQQRSSRGGLEVSTILAADGKRAIVQVLAGDSFLAHITPGEARAQAAIFQEAAAASEMDAFLFEYLTVRLALNEAVANSIIRIGREDRTVFMAKIKASALSSD